MDIVWPEGIRSPHRKFFAISAEKPEASVWASVEQFHTVIVPDESVTVLDVKIVRGLKSHTLVATHGFVATLSAVRLSRTPRRGGAANVLEMAALRPDVRLK